jgi:DNA polymerase kappa
LCLSRQTIRDAVQETSTSTSESRSRDPTPATKRAKSSKSGVPGDPKQRRLFFG